MIAVDTNVLVCAHRRELPLHAKAEQRLTDLAQGDDAWAIPVFCLGEMARVITHPRVFENPHSTDEAADAIRRLLGSPSLRVLMPGPRYVPLFLDALTDGAVSGNLAFDAQIVALCRESGVRALLTEDRDFARFRGFGVERL